MERAVLPFSLPKAKKKTRREKLLTRKVTAGLKATAASIMEHVQRRCGATSTNQIKLNSPTTDTYYDFYQRQPLKHVEISIVLPYYLLSLLRRIQTHTLIEFVFLYCLIS